MGWLATGTDLGILAGTLLGIFFLDGEAFGVSLWRLGFFFLFIVQIGVIFLARHYVTDILHTKDLYHGF